MVQTYPVILIKAEGVPPLMPSKGKNAKSKKRGNSELVVRSRICGLGLKDIKMDVCMKIDGHNYEPDLAYLSDDVCVDIEIDEPYSVSGHPTHFLMNDGTNKDSDRNRRFQDAGWHVIRFSEEQFFCHTGSCMKEVYRLLLSAGAIKEIPSNLANQPDLVNVPRWTEEDSRKLNRENFRATYLGWNPANMDLKGKLCCCKLLVPIMWHSLFNADLRKEMCIELKNYIKYSK